MISKGKLGKDARESQRRWVFRLIYFVGLALAVWGSIQVYTGITEPIGKRISNIMFSTMKLFLFAPTYSIKPSGSLAYELAIWICPIGTVLGFFQVFKPYLVQLRLAFSHWGAHPTIVAGANEISLQFIETVIRDYPNEKIVLLVGDSKEKQDNAYLEDDGVRVLAFDYRLPEHPRNRALMNRFRLYRAARIISFESDPVNFTHLESLNRVFAPCISRPIPLHMMSGSFKLKEMIEETTKNWKFFDIHFFDMDTLGALQLLENPEYKLYTTPGLISDWNKDDLQSERSIADKIGRCHLLLVGLGKTGRAMLMESINQACVNPFSRFRVTIIDKDATNCLEIFDRDIDQREKIAEIELIETDLRSNKVQKRLSEIKNVEPFTAVIYCLEDAYLSMLSIERLWGYFADSQVAVYCGGKTDVSALLGVYNNRGQRVISFGEAKKILTPEHIVNENQLLNAKSFNKSYNDTISELLSFPPDKRDKDAQWESLTTLAKESNLAQTLHRGTKLAILEKIASVNAEDGSVARLISAFRKRLLGLSISEQVNIIEKDPVMNFLTQLEHVRWNNFQYIRNFSYAPKKRPCR